jgi:putative oxidoreductase
VTIFKRILSVPPLSLDLGLLFFRAAAGGLMLFHGLPKLVGFAERKDSFADPIGLGTTLSLTLTIGAEFFCSILLILGLFTRFALVPLMFTMSVIIFVVHGDDPWKEKELPLTYLLSFIGIFLTGPGKYSADTLLRK